MLKIDTLHHVHVEVADAAGNERFVRAFGLVEDIEQQMFAHRHLQKEGGSSPVWGVGRHPLGSHIFDMWKDPNGFRFETFSDTDWCNEERRTVDYPVQHSEIDLWSNDSFERYFA